MTKRCENRHVCFRRTRKRQQDQLQLHILIVIAISLSQTSSANYWYKTHTRRSKVFLINTVLLHTIEVYFWFDKGKYELINHKITYKIFSMTSILLLLLFGNVYSRFIEKSWAFSLFVGEKKAGLHKGKINFSIKCGVFKSLEEDKNQQWQCTNE